MSTNNNANDGDYAGQRDNLRLLFRVEQMIPEVAALSDTSWREGHDEPDAELRKVREELEGLLGRIEQAVNRRNESNESEN